jgi:hypothetical protein
LAIIIVINGLQGAKWGECHTNCHSPESEGSMLQFGLFFEADCTESIALNPGLQETPESRSLVGLKASS